MGIIDKHIHVFLFSGIIFIISLIFPVYRILKNLDIHITISDINRYINTYFGFINNHQVLQYQQAAVLLAIIIGFIILLYVFEYIKIHGVGIYDEDHDEYKYFSALPKLPTFFIIFAVPALFAYLFEKIIYFSITSHLILFTNQNIITAIGYWYYGKIQILFFLIQILSICLAGVVFLVTYRLSDLFNHVVKNHNYLVECNKNSKFIYSNDKDNKAYNEFIQILKEFSMDINSEFNDNVIKRYLPLLDYIREFRDMILDIIVCSMIFFIILAIILEFNLLSVLFIDICLLNLYTIVCASSSLPKQVYNFTLKTEINPNIVTGYMYYHLSKKYITIMPLGESGKSAIIIKKGDVLKYVELETSKEFLINLK